MLLDACIPERFARFLPVLELIPNREFDAFVTVDKNLRFQQNLRGRPFRIVLMRARSNALEYLVPLVPQLQAALVDAVPGDLRVVGV